MTTYTASTRTFTAPASPITCYLCGIPFAVPSEWRKARLRKGDSFWCPNGHQQHYTRTTEDELRDDVKFWRERARTEEESLRQEKRRHAATKGTLTKTRKRIHAGVCPHCNRTFENVARHMASQHAEEAS